MENGNCSNVGQQNGMVVVQNGLDEDKYIKLVLFRLIFVKFYYE